MASCSITVHRMKTGEKRYVVRYRLGGRAYPIVHGGTFITIREARQRRAWDAQTRSRAAAHREAAD